MKLVTGVEQWRNTLSEMRGRDGVVGFVPTMGALHEGHLSLMHRARAECAVVTVSIFVNPLQFGANEDLTRYPRPLERDLELSEAAGVDVVFHPGVDEMYPSPLFTTVSVAHLTDRLEGASRPGHFDGVATVVAKLFSMVGACRAYFGEKDWQQLQVVRRMVRDLSMPVEVIGCPTVRDADGLALSSRNVYLSQDEREAALCLHRALDEAARLVTVSEVRAQAVVEHMVHVVSREPLVDLIYAEVVGSDLDELETIHGDERLVIAANVGSTHLIDNRAVKQ